MTWSTGTLGQLFITFSQLFMVTEDFYHDWSSVFPPWGQNKSRFLLWWSYYLRRLNKQGWPVTGNPGLTRRIVENSRTVSIRGLSLLRVGYELTGKYLWVSTETFRSLWQLIWGWAKVFEKEGDLKGPYTCRRVGVVSYEDLREDKT